jgi:Nucleotidyl transferase AbiEii toxin, Type IV TA system
VANERQILPILVEKDYWIMHCLWGLQQQGFQFALKGGTSLSKGLGIIERFSEDIDMQIYPPKGNQIPINKNQNKPAHVETRRQFFDRIAQSLNIADFHFQRDFNFDDHKKMRGAGIRGEYCSLFTTTAVLKEGIVLELGFDNVTPNLPCDITSWVMEKILALNIPVIDNRAKQVLCAYFGRTERRLRSESEY